MAEQKFIFESIQDSETIKSYLESIITGIAKKKIVLSTDGEDITLHPNGLLKLTVKARKKADKNRISIKMAWTDERARLGDHNKTIEINS
jgi:amphi-Trp domain-containing protein